MPVNLNAPLAWKKADRDEQAMLEQLQANVLTPYVRHHLEVLFVHFEDPGAGRSFLRSVRRHMPSASAHLQAVDEYRRTTREENVPYVGLGLTSRGYAAIGLPPSAEWAEPFLKGMADPTFRSAVGDPDVETWDEPYGRYEGSDVIHAVVLIGDSSAERAATASMEVRQLLSTDVRLVREETGRGMTNDNGDPIEHFGYVDGRSQPLFLLEDVEHERQRSTGTERWDPTFPLGRVLVHDSFRPASEPSYGSYLVFRKLEQNVRRFKMEEQELAVALQLENEDAERAGAMIVGRFEDGTPMSLQSDEGMHHPVSNDFDYQSDPAGTKCPVFAHIRLVNPRTGRSADSGGVDPRIMARRGQTYGVRTDDPNDGRIANKPTTDVGLLFMAMNVDIDAQFIAVQRDLANGAPRPDQLIQQGLARPTSYRYPVIWGGADEPASWREAGPLGQSVTMKGGDYFFLPSLRFLETLPEL